MKLLPLVLAALVVAVPASSAANDPGPKRDSVAAYWSPERRAQAQPRDLVFDDRGLAYLRGRGAALQPYGHDVAARVSAAPARGVPAAGKPGGSDTTPPNVSGMDPAAGTTIGASYTFKATVTDAESGVRSVTFVLTYPDGRTQSASAAQGAGNVWSVAFSGFWDGNWSWHVVAKDSGAKGGNTTTTAQVPFTVSTGSGGGGGGGGGSTVTNAQWTGGGAVQTAAGRIYFEMPANKGLTRWSGYVCSGTVVTDTRSDASVILTAAHCVYDDVNKVFARNVLFIPNQAGTTGSGTDRDCSNDPLGCWSPSYGVVDANWTTRKWPNNIPWDYAFYVAPSSLEEAARTLAISFAAPATGAGAYTHALGYSYSEDPKFMYCAEDMTTEGASNWWLSQCGLSGGSSGGPWMQPVSGGNGPVISVNSWGYTNSPGMAGPKLAGTSAECVFGVAQGTTQPVDRGVVATC